MAGLSKAIVIGNLGRDPEKRFTQAGRAMTRFSVAATTRRRDKEGNWQDHTEWFNVTSFDRQAETLAERLTKGSRVYVEGRLESRTYDGANGRGFSMDIVANEVVMLDPRTREGEAGGAGDHGFDSVPAGERPSSPAGQGSPLEDAGDLEDLPF